MAADPEATSVTVPTPQIDADGGVTVTDGVGLTVTVLNAVSLEPQLSVTITE